MDATEAARREAERIHQAAVAAGDDPWKLLDFVLREVIRRDPCTEESRASARDRH